MITFEGALAKTFACLKEYREEFDPIGHSSRALKDIYKMADKFPEINDVSVDGTEQPSGDFLSREKAALGDEFATDEDQKIVQEAEEGDDDEFQDFKTQFPAVDSQASETVAADKETEKGEASESDDLNEGTAAVTKKFDSLNMEESEPVKEWKQKKEAEITEKDEADAKKLQGLKEDAQKATDEFYENYNNKKDVLIEQTKKEEKKFLEKRDSFLEKGTVWDHAIELLKLNKNSSSVDDENHRDKTRFKEILLSLKGKETVPGAQGVSEN